MRLLLVSVLMTAVTTAVLGVGYPLAVTALAQALFPRQANGLDVTGRHVGGDLIGQPFASAGYFWSRPSAAGRGYDAGASGGSNLGPTNRTLVDRVRADVARLQATNPGVPVPVDLVTTSASGSTPTSHRPRRRSRCRAWRGNVDSTPPWSRDWSRRTPRGASSAGWENRACTSCG